MGLGIVTEYVIVIFNALFLKKNFGVKLFSKQQRRKHFIEYKNSLCSVGEWLKPGWACANFDSEQQNFATQ